MQSLFIRLVAMFMRPFLKSQREVQMSQPIQIQLTPALRSLISESQAETYATAIIDYALKSKEVNGLHPNKLLIRVGATEHELPVCSILTNLKKHEPELPSENEEEAQFSALLYEDFVSPVRHTQPN